MPVGSCKDCGFPGGSLYSLAGRNGGFHGRLAVKYESDCNMDLSQQMSLPARPHRTMDAMRQVLLDILRAQAGESALGWLDKALAAAKAPVHANTLLGYHAGASRRMGKQVLKLTRHEAARLAETAPGVSFAEWGRDEFARAVLLLSLYPLDTETRRELIYQCYEKGDSREQESWLRILPLLPDGETFLDTAIDACRTNIVPVFEAIACENPYPLKYFPEANFNQVVLKALFMGLAIHRIFGLESRFNPELSRMCADYVSEREAAGRSVPADIWLALAPCAENGRLSRVAAYLHHEETAHRYWAARGLGFSKAAESRALLNGRAGTEQEQNVAGAIQDALEKLG